MPLSFYTFRLGIMESSGLLMKWKKEFWPGDPRVCATGRTKQVKYKLAHVYEIFKIVFFCLALATTTLCVEIITKIIRQK